MTIDIKGKEFHQFVRLCKRLESTPEGLTNANLYAHILYARMHGKRF